MIIYFRICEKPETISNVSRVPFSANKAEMIRVCWNSLNNSIADTDRVYVLHDEVSENTLSHITKTSKTSNITFIEIPKHDWSYHQHTVSLIDLLERNSSIFPDEFHYIVEDDYIHMNDALDIIKADTFINTNNCFVVTYDYPDRYFTSNLKPAYILLGSNNYWRTIDSATMTVMAKGSLWLKYIEKLKEAAPTSNDHVFLKIFEEIGCVSPIPSLSSHLTAHHLSPYLNWEKLYNDNL